MALPLRFGVWALTHGSWASRHHPHDPPDASWARVKRQILDAEALGYDSTLLAQHMMHPSGDDQDLLEAWTRAAALAAITDRIELISAIKPLLHHPVVLAKMALQVEEISGGRFGLNLVNAWYKPKLERAGIGFPSHEVPAVAEAVHDVARLKYLGGGHGEGCNEGDDAFTLWRRRFHHFTLYGFLLCFASTCMATLYHYIWKLQAPYAYTSAPVILGTLGGIGLIIGPVGLLWLNFKRDALRADVKQNAMDRGFIMLLLLVSVTGLLLLVLRDTRFMALWLAIHLGTVMALFVTLPYGKFAHSIFRSAALLKFNIEKRMPNRLGLGGE